ncbi:DUF2147 domain-containing protein, partial [Flavobacteriales bacterium]|nr:DUF2147 domain-containing protein [Flavobacteriales bacterium]
MKKIIGVLALAFLTFFSFAQTNADVIGEWYNAEKDAVITIFEENNSLSGKITWMLHPNDENGNPKTDPLNPNESLRSRARLGMVMMHSFSHIDGRIWDNGKLYDPKKGKTYTGMVTLIDANTLDLRGYILLS